eukprot:gnl/TRDRNA2_/TRDRNA2_34087_c0_seq1.p1 gnl/TRDRNA2_/TRDRNA2_34087_c0~~gnl/TRDRNA2_/TRDRNA2_34087_c0_seq1.p1  ORF type:complete len:367 (-),score=62.88 gnl/TRDRNA2_/TRDRNA2_34087_c0_seq1:23-1123(-)
MHIVTAIILLALVVEPLAKASGKLPSSSARRLTDAAPAATSSDMLEDASFARANEKDTFVPAESAPPVERLDLKDVNHFDVVRVRSEPARQLFERMLQLFEWPPSDNWSPEAYRVYKGVVSKHMRSLNATGMLAMDGRMPCAAALYMDSPLNPTRMDTYLFTNFIRNRGDNCAGGGAALLCYLIRNSKNRDGGSSALQVDTSEEPKLKSYWESFGCVGERFAVCGDPNPPKCAPYVSEAVEADNYFENMTAACASAKAATAEVDAALEAARLAAAEAKRISEIPTFPKLKRGFFDTQKQRSAALYVQSSCDVVSKFAALLTGAFVGGGAALALLRGCGKKSSAEQSLLSRVSSQGAWSTSSISTMG